MAAAPKTEKSNQGAVLKTSFSAQVVLYRGRGPRFGFANQARLWAGAEFFAFCMVIISVISLTVDIMRANKKN